MFTNRKYENRNLKALYGLFSQYKCVFCALFFIHKSTEDKLSKFNRTRKLANGKIDS